MTIRPAPRVAVVDKLLCDACGLCMPLCPPLAIEMRREGLVIDDRSCTGCNKCIAPCPTGALRMVPAPVMTAASPATLATTPPATPSAM